MTGSSPLSHSALLLALLAALSHELGSPLAAIKGAATTLIDSRQRLPDERIAGFLHSIDQQTDQLNDLLDDLVLLAKIEVQASARRHGLTQLLLGHTTDLTAYPIDASQHGSIYNEVALRLDAQDRRLTHGLWSG